MSLCATILKAAKQNGVDIARLGSSIPRTAKVCPVGPEKHPLLLWKNTAFQGHLTRAETIRESRGKPTLPGYEVDEEQHQPLPWSLDVV